MTPEIATHWQIGWGVPGGASTALFMGVALLVLAVLGSRPKASGARAAVLVLLRWLSAVAIFALTTQPTFWSERIRTEPGNLAVVVDVSRSMGVQTDGATRFERNQTSPRTLDAQRAWRPGRMVLARRRCAARGALSRRRRQRAARSRDCPDSSAHGAFEPCRPRGHRGPERRCRHAGDSPSQAARNAVHTSLPGTRGHCATTQSCGLRPMRSPSYTGAPRCTSP